MNKNEKIEIKNIENGYIVEHSWRERRDNPVDSYDYNYVEKQYMFANWDDVVKFIADHKLDIPPQNV